MIAPTMVSALSVLPANAGVILIVPPGEWFADGAPRERGGDPSPLALSPTEESCSPRTRG